MRNTTPGDWFISEESDGYYIKADRSDPTYVANIRLTKRGRTGPYDRANANVMSAAPELLKALNYTLQVLENLEYENHPAYIVAREAIAKAEGNP